MIVHRICKARYGDAAFSGVGGMEASGRWHHRGSPVVYAAQTLSLAALEYLAHLGRRDTKASFVWVQATIPDDVNVDILDPATLPGHWSTSPPIEATMMLGTAWLAASRGAVLKVPSAVIETEFNFLINPRHSDFARIRVSSAKQFSFDSRLLSMNLPARAGSTKLPSLPAGRRVGDEGRDATAGSWARCAARAPWRLSPVR